jgi:Tfp pilus assembly protein PilX
MSAVSSDRRITSYNMTRAQALNYAEAGVAEAMERIRNGDVPDNRKPPWCRRSI